MSLSKEDDFSKSRAIKKKLCLEDGVSRIQELKDYAGEVGNFVGVAFEEVDEPISDFCKGFTCNQDVRDVFLD